MLIMRNFNYEILTFILITLPLYLLIGLLPVPFWYLASIRWVILTVCIYLAILSLSRDFPINFFLMLCIMFIFRPIYPFILDGILWTFFNVVAIVLFSLTIFYLREDCKRIAEINLPDLSKHINNGNI